MREPDKKQGLGAQILGQGVCRAFGHYPANSNVSINESKYLTHYLFFKSLNGFFMEEIYSVISNTPLGELVNSPLGLSRMFTAIFHSQFFPHAGIHSLSAFKFPTFLQLFLYHSNFHPNF